MRKIKNRLLSILVAFSMVATLFVGRPISVSAADPDPNAPVTVKTVTDNGDGTQKIRLDITGKVNTTTDITKANVVIIFDTSGSMSNSAGNTTRLAAAKAAVNSVANTLLGLNGKDGNPSDLVEMALVSFSTSATAGSKTSSLSTFQTAVNRLSADGGTNWEAALTAARNINFNDSDLTYYIFVSDGNPTYRDTQYTNEPLPVTDNPRWYSTWNGRIYPNSNYDYYGDDKRDDRTQYGLGSDDPDNVNYSATSMDRCYQTAKTAAVTLSNANGRRFYGIGTYGNAAWVENLVTDANGSNEKYYPANDTAALNTALADIAKAVTDSLGQSNVHTDDGITGLSNLESKVQGTASGFTYYITESGQPERVWTDAPDAKFEDGKVVWDLSEVGALGDGTKYSVEFDVWPSQEAYDLIADLNNGTIDYDGLDQSIKDQIEKNGNTYSLLTNTSLSTTYTYNGEEKTQEFEKGHGSMRLVSSGISVKKYWENGLDERYATPINLKVMEGNQVQKEFTLTPVAQEGGGWVAESGEVFIAPGVIHGQPTNGTYSDDQILETGHDYTVVEGQNDAYYWELDADVYHPMVVNGTLTLFKEDENGTVSFSGKKYTVVSEGVGELDAYNYRRSNLNLKKEVNDNSDGLAPEDAMFGYSITVTDANAAANGNQIWFSVMDENGTTVKNITTSATAEAGDTGYYYGTSGQAFTVELKEGWNLRVINLPSTSTYTIKETTMPGGFYFNKAVTDSENPTFGEQSVSGAIDAPNESYQVTFTNDYDGFFYVYHTSMTGNDAGVIETYPVHGNEKFDINALTADGTYYGGYYDNYYYKGTIDTATDPSNATVAAGTGKAYNGQSLGFNKAKSTAYTTDGTKMKPKAGNVYYLKEVPNTYLNEKVYNKQKTYEPYDVVSISAIANVDDKNYDEYGFYFDGTKNAVSSLASNFKETKYNSETVTHTGKTLFGTTNTGYLVIKAYTSMIKKGGTYQVNPYWVTPDGIEVKSDITRTITAGDLTKDTFTVE